MSRQGRTHIEGSLKPLGLPGSILIWLTLFCVPSLAQFRARIPSTMPDIKTLVPSAIVSTGNPAPFQRVFAKARAGEPIVLGVIGGSITAGAKASDESHRWANLLQQWLARQFPESTVTLINAGIGATGSPYGCLRVGRDLIAHHPDLVVIDFGVNDGPEKWMAQTYEGVLRQILRQSPVPAVMEIFFMHLDGGNAQLYQQQIGAHYGLPMVSYRDALWPLIKAGQLTWEDVSPDDVHPNDWGHAFAAACLEFQLDAASRATSFSRTADSALPSPLLSDVYSHTTLMDKTALKPLAAGGWRYDEAHAALIATEPGSALEFHARGSAVFVQFFRVRANLGQAILQIDNLPPVTLDGWFPGTWGGYIDTYVARDLPSGDHVCRLTLSREKSELSRGHEFRLIGIGQAGEEPAK
jgi:hypothetical protein